MLSQCRNNVLTAFSPLSWYAYRRRRACGAVSPVGLLGSGRFSFSVEPPRFSRLSWPSEFLQALIVVFFSGATICFADYARRRLLLYIDDFSSAASTSS